MADIFTIKIVQAFVKETYVRIFPSIMPVAIDSIRPVYHGIQHLGNVTDLYGAVVVKLHTRRISDVTNSRPC